MLAESIPSEDYFGVVVGSHSMPLSWLLVTSGRTLGVPGKVTALQSLLPPQGLFLCAFLSPVLFYKNILIGFRHTQSPPAPIQSGASLVAQLVKNPPAMKEILVRFLVRKVPLEKG